MSIAATHIGTNTNENVTDGLIWMSIGCSICAEKEEKAYLVPIEFLDNSSALIWSL